jgi:predicted RNA methylase
MAETIDGALQAALAACSLSGNYVAVQDQLPSEVYEDLKELLERIGGKWKGKLRRTQGRTAFVFAYDPQPTIMAMLATGVLPPKNPTAFYPTPVAVADEMMVEADLQRFSGMTLTVRMLEPSAGQGGLCRAALRAAQAAGIKLEIDVFEILSLNRFVLAELEPHINIVGHDILRQAPTRRYDLVIANPPFRTDADKMAWITHLWQYFQLLNDGGRLVAIAPQSLLINDTERVKAFRRFVRRYGRIVQLPEGSFKESGTGVNTVMLVMDRKSAAWEADRRKPYEGCHCGECYDVRRLFYSEQEAHRKRVALFKSLLNNELPVDISGWPIGVGEIAVFGLHNWCAEQTGADLADPCRVWLTERFLEDFTDWMTNGRPEPEPEPQPERSEPEYEDPLVLVEKIQSNLRDAIATMEGIKGLLQRGWQAEEGDAADGTDEV